MEYLVTILILIILIFAFRSSIKRITIYDYEKGLKYTKGKFIGLLGPGLYFLIPMFSSIEKIDLRPTLLSVSGQEVLSSDGVQLKVSLAAKYEVINPETAVNKNENYQSTLYLELQLALRKIIGGATMDDLLNQRQEFGQRLLEITSPKAEEMGINLLTVDIKDIMLPGELKKIYTQVVKAKQESLALLEKTRGESAALRNLANAAQLVKKNPHLMQLRILEVMGQSSGNTLVYGMPAQTEPVPIKTKVSQGSDSRQRSNLDGD